MARGTGRLLGFNFVKNFNSPYLSISPSDFWRRWHISFSEWIRDYLYIPMGGSRVKTKRKLFVVLMSSMGLCGLWHGAQWTFVVWGMYHGFLVFIYRIFGMGGHWEPKGKISRLIAWVVMFFLICVGWSIFRASSISWLLDIFGDGYAWGFSGDTLITSVVIFSYLILYTSPLLLFFFLDRMIPAKNYINAAFYSLCLVSIIIFFRDSGQDFIYFQF
ncbi:MAG: hypothetical protein D3910_14025 [Candidatus Electrothrix sp. ATG2]|nr:hypothetical protein [Candidatus Electrothrix sp. ATG2]